MGIDRTNPRVPAADIDSMFIDRWSPRAFHSEELAREQVEGLLEAARWSPSCFNEQPWLFMVAASPADRERYCSALTEKNQSWVVRAPLLIFLFAKRAFTRNGKPNRHAGFDAGAAWMALALQARKFGLHAHGMAGFDAARAYEVTGVPESDYEVYAAIAVGRRSEPTELSEDLARAETPSTRKPLEQVGQFGRFESPA